MSYTYPHHNATGQQPGVAPSHASSPSSFQPPSGPQSDISYSRITTDQANASSLPPPSSSQRQQGPIAAAPRSTSLPFASYMGSSQSKPSASTPPSTASKGLTAAVAGGNRLKRAFARRRKNDEGQEQESGPRPAPSSSLLATDKAAKPQPLSVQRSSPRRVDSAQQPVSPRSIAISSQQQQPQSPPPPLPPKKEVPPAQPESRSASEVLSAGSRNSIMPISPGISSAVNYISMMDQQQAAGPKQEADKENVKGTEKRDMKESWRKSDSTNSHHTIRPGGAGASRLSRPVSWAESFQSAHTVVQASSRRLSALIGDADFGMAEEDDDGGSSSASHGAPQPSPSPSPSSSIRSKNRRSMSLNLDMSSLTKFGISPPQSAPPTELKYPHAMAVAEAQNAFTVTPFRAPAVASSVSQPQAQSAGANLKGRIAALTNPYHAPPPTRVQTQAPALPQIAQRFLSPVPQHPHAQPPSSFVTSPASPSPRSSSPGTSPSSFRQTAISMSAGVGPAAAGLAKRAVEKMGRKWALGMGMSSSSSGSGGGGGWTSSSSSSTHTHTTTTGGSSHSHALARTSSNQSTQSVAGFFMGSAHAHSKSVGPTPGLTSESGAANAAGHRRTPGSISSGLSSSDSDFFAPAPGPVLGTQLRGALRTKNGAKVVGGVVFGRDLAAGVRETGVKVGKAPGAQPQVQEKEGLLGALEERTLAAVAVRCAQHLLVWGVQEEGLFRVTGRSLHASKLRTEFDSGADYDMMTCSPADLDPHAVSSVFKAYLRELPEPILTHRLQPLFDAAVNKETTSNTADINNAPRQAVRGQGLPSGPKNGFAGLRKPPSLSTLAMPSFTGIPPPSKSLIAALRTLVAQLPPANRDLVRTIVDLIRATSARAKETKMPLTNLLVVFCPSVNMAPPLLKVLCEAEGIWGDAEVDETPVIDIRRQPEAAKEEDARSAMGDEEGSVRSGRPSLDNPSSEYYGSTEGSIYEGQSQPRRRAADFERSEIPTVYLDSRSQCSSSSSASLAQASMGKYGQSYMHHSRDDGSISSDNYSMNGIPPSSSSPPPLSSSAESIATPTTSSNPSFTNLHLESTDKDQESLHGQHQHHARSGPQIAEATPLELMPQGSKRPFISNPIPITGPIQFPVSPTPKQAHVAVRRRSIPLLSLPSFSPSTSPLLGSAPAQSPMSSPKAGSPSPGLRTKKPSLKLLFSKRSTSSLKELERTSAGISLISAPIQQYAGHSPKAGSDSSVSTPLSAVTAPQSSFPGSGSSTQLAHVLDTPIEDSSLSMDLGFDMSPPKIATLADKHLKQGDQVAKSNSANETAHTSPYNYPTTKPLAVNPKRTIKPGEDHIRPQASSSNLSIISTTSSHHLSLFEDDDDEPMEDWTQSVLLAADKDGQWSIQKPAATPKA